MAFFGQKDAQQAAIIQQMARDLDLFTEVRIVPTVREPDGLAMSSRNRFLDPIQRRNAVVLFRTLEKVRNRVQQGERDVSRLENLMQQELASTPGAVVDYARIVDAQFLQPVSRLEQPGLAALAVFFGPTRLIDNMRLEWK